MLKLRLQYFGHLMQRADSLGKTLILGKIEGRRRRGLQRRRWLDGITHSMNMSLSKHQDQWRTGKSGVLQSTGWQRVEHDSVTEQLESAIRDRMWISSGRSIGGRWERMWGRYPWEGDRNALACQGRKACRFLEAEEWSQWVRRFPLWEERLASALPESGVDLGVGQPGHVE